MRIVALALVGVALIAGAFGLGRVTRASADDPAPRQAVATPVPLGAAQPVSASGLEAAASLPALRPAPRKPKPKPKPKTPTSSGSGTSTPPPAATTAPSAPRPSTPAPTPKPKQPSKPVEEIG